MLCEIKNERQFLVCIFNSNLYHPDINFLVHTQIFIDHWILDKWLDLFSLFLLHLVSCPCLFPLDTDSSFLLLPPPVLNI